MSGVSDYCAKALLDWMFSTGAVTQPSVWAVGLSTGVPTSTAAYESMAGGYSRSSATFAAASSSGITTCNTTLVFGPFTSSYTITGITIWDATAAGNYLWWGTLSSATDVVSGQTLIIPSGGITPILTG